MFDRVLSEFAGLDILVNNAGTQVWAPLLEGGREGVVDGEGGGEGDIHSTHK